MDLSILPHDVEQIVIYYVCQLCTYCHDLQKKRKINYMISLISYQIHPWCGQYHFWLDAYGYCYQITGKVARWPKRNLWLPYGENGLIKQRYIPDWSGIGATCILNDLNVIPTNGM